MKKEAYIKDAHARLEKYIDFVLRQKDLPAEDRVVNKYEILSVVRYKNDLNRKDLFFNRDSFDRALTFFHFLRINYDNNYVQFVLHEIQLFWLANLYGLYYTGTDRRKYSLSYIEIAKKNGKTAFFAGVGLYELMGDGELDAQVILLATSRDQAKLALDYARGMILNTPPISKRLKVIKYDITYNYKDKRRGVRSINTMKVKAADATGTEGLNSSFSLVDEMHEHKNLDLFNSIKSGQVARKNPLVAVITTAGANKDYPAYEIRNACTNVLEGVAENDSLFTVIYTLDDPEKEQGDVKKWRKPNPLLNVTVRLENLEKDYRDAVNIPSTLNNFKTKNLNLWIDGEDNWIPDEDYKKVMIEPDLEKLKGSPVWLGVDLSSTKDLSALSALWFNEEEQKFYSKTFFFFPDNPRKRFRQNGLIDLSKWINQGHIIKSPRRTIDYDQIYEKIIGLSANFDIQNVIYDKFNSAFLIPRLEDAGIFCKSLPQTPMYFNMPLKLLESTIYNERIEISANPVLRWNFRNIVIWNDSNNNIKISKNKCLDSVDGAVSLGMAFAGWLNDNFDEETQALNNYRFYSC